MIDPDIALEACRFLHDASLMLLWGASAFLLFLVPERLAGRIWRMFGSAFAIMAIVAGLSAALSLPLQAAIIGSGWSDAIDAGTLHDVLFETTIGRAWMAQVAAAAVLILALILPTALRRPGIVLGSGLGLVSLVLTGHASMHQGLLLAAHRANDALHLLSGGAWLGALLPLVPILRLLDAPDLRGEALLSLRRFSTAGHGAVALVILSGILNMLLVLQRLPTDWSSSYQALLGFKIVLIAGMTMLAVANRYVFVPRMREDRRRSLAAIRLGSIAEIVLAVAAIALVAAFGTMEPV